MGRKTPLAMEPRSYVCDINKRNNELTLYSSTQVPGIIKDAIMTYLGINGNQITVIAPDVGGGFGGKASLYMEELIVVAIANKLQTPVKWVSDRYEDLLTTSQGFEEIIEAEDESEAELDALVHCKMYLQEYVNAEIEEIKKG